MTDDLLEPFVSEARELVQAASDDLLELEHAPGDAARIDSAFRAFHTLKGSAALLDFAPMGAVLHAGEDLLGAMRAAALPDAAHATDALLRCIGLVDGWVEIVSHGAPLPPGAPHEAARLAAEMVALLTGGLTGGDMPLVARQGALPAWLAALPPRARAAADAAAEAGETLTALRYAPDEDCFYRGDDPLALVRGIPLLRALEVRPRVAWPPGAVEPFRCNLLIEALSAAPPDAVREAMRLAAGQTDIVLLHAGALGAGARPATTDGAPAAPQDAAADALAGVRALRVDGARVDELVDIVGELVVAKNVLAHLAADAARLSPALARALRANHADIERLAAQLQRGMARLRSVKLDRSFRRLPRVARDTAARLGKLVALRMTGADTEADKNVVDALYEPLLHAVRNAIDHGIEDPARREAAGKSRAGTITLAAERSGEQLVVLVRDDGAGIDNAKVRQTVVERGLMEADVVAGLSDAAALDLLFMPGFSTARAVTDISGRGVGLDAVRRALAVLGGTVSINSQRGAGSTLRIAVPLAVAITTIVVVRVGDLQFGVPIEAVLQTIRLKPAQITALQAGCAFVLRDRIVPLVHLGGLLGIARPAGGAAADIKVLVASVAGTYLGLEVDGFGDRMEVVLRPLGGLLAGMPGIGGTALLGDGSVLLVLDVAQLASRGSLP